MASAGEANETGGPGESRGHCGVALNFDGATAVQNHGLESGSRKRKTIVMSRNSTNLVESREVFEASVEDSRISVDIKNLRSQLDEDVKELRYCEENKKLRVEMDLKNKEMQCLWKRNEELQAKYKDLQIKYKKQNEELHAMNGKPNVHAFLHKNFEKILENQIDAKRKQLRQLEGLYSTVESPLTQLEEGKRLPDMSFDEDSNSKLVDESSAEKSASLIVDDDNLKRLELEVADLDAKIQIKMEKLGEMLDSAKFSEELGAVTVWKSIQTNMELQDIRKGLIAGLENMLGHKNIGIKRMGEINYLSLRKACQRKYRKDEAEVNTAILASFWSEELRKPSWHPFKIVEIGGRLKEVLNNDDAKLKLMRNEFGDDACNAVKTALMELNEYNPSERQAVPEFWNFGKEQKATVEEILKFMFSHLRKRHRA